MLGSQQRFNSSMNSLVGNANGGPYPTAQSGPLQLPNDPTHIPILRTQSPKPPSPRNHHQSQPGPPHPSMHNRMPTRPIPNPATAFPSFTAGRSFSSEAQLQHIINWQTVTSRNPFEEPPTFQSLLIFILPSVPSPAVNTYVKQIINTADQIAHLQKCWAILKRNDREELVSFGLPERVGDMRFEIYRMWLMVRLAWRIVQGLKNAKEGSRIAEVGEWVMYVIEMNKSVSPEKFDPVPMQTLACSLTYPHPSMSINSKTRDTVTPLQRGDRDKMALEYFAMGFPGPENSSIFLPSTVYAKAHHARLLRRLEYIQDAEDIEQSIRNWWIKTGRGMMSKSKFTDIVCLEGEDRYDNVILKSLEGFFERRSENGSSTGEEADSSSGRDSGIDVTPITPTLESKPVPLSKPLPQVPPKNQTTAQTLPLLKPYSPQLAYYTGSSESLNSNPGNDSKKARHGFGSKIGFHRKDRAVS